MTQMSLEELKFRKIIKSFKESDGAGLGLANDSVVLHELEIKNLQEMERFCRFFLVNCTGEDGISPLLLYKYYIIKPIKLFKGYPQTQNSTSTRRTLPKGSESAQDIQQRKGIAPKLLKMQDVTDPELEFEVEKIIKEQLQNRDSFESWQSKIYNLLCSLHRGRDDDLYFNSRYQSEYDLHDFARTRIFSNYQRLFWETFLGYQLTMVDSGYRQAHPNQKIDLSFTYSIHKNDVHMNRSDMGFIPPLLHSYNPMVKRDFYDIYAFGIELKLKNISLWLTETDGYTIKQDDDNILESIRGCLNQIITYSMKNGNRYTSISDLSCTIVLLIDETFLEERLSKYVDPREPIETISFYYKVFHNGMNYENPERPLSFQKAMTTIIFSEITRRTDNDRCQFIDKLERILSKDKRKIRRLRSSSSHSHSSSSHSSSHPSSTDSSNSTTGTGSHFDASKETLHSTTDGLPTIQEDAQENSMEIDELYEVHNINSLREIASYFESVPFNYELLQYSYFDEYQVCSFTTLVLKTYFPTIFESLLPEVLQVDKIVLKVYNKKVMRDNFYPRSDHWFDYGSPENAYQIMDEYYSNEVSSYLKIDRFNKRIEDERQKVKCPKLLKYGKSITLEFPDILNYPDLDQSYQWFNYPFVRMEGKFIVTEYLPNDPIRNYSQFFQEGRKQLKLLFENVKLAHGDIATRNIRNVGGQFYLIDFARAKPIESEDGEDLMAKDKRYLEQAFKNLQEESDMS